MLKEADYELAARRLKWPVAHVKAMADVESAGETFWTIDGAQVPAVRFEAHHFGQRTGYRFNASHPHLSCRGWDISLAATTRAGAWAQVREAEKLDLVAAWESTSWGPFQVMGFNWKRLKYASVSELVDSMWSVAGQLEAFIRYIEADHALIASGALGAWLDVEKRYNGGGFNGAYAEKLAARAAFYGSPKNVRAVPRLLKRGMKGEDVIELQAALGVLPDGDFGDLTDRAVRGFQQAHGLTADGLVGTLTRSALGI